MPENENDGDVFAEVAGDPGEAAGLPASSGRDPAAGIPDSILVAVLDEEAGE